MTFGDKVLFRGTKFVEQASFNSITFKRDSDFTEATFNKGVEFLNTQFTRGNFSHTRFHGPTIFDASSRVPMFDGEVLFTQTIIDPGDSLKFIEADLTHCRFLGTDVRKVHFIGVRWAHVGGRHRVHDETASLESGKQRPWAQIEELYRQLKQNYEERRDYERAGDFHVGEKEMRLRNPDTRRDLRVLLTLYKGISGYGENYRRPLLWLGVLWIYTSALLLAGGLKKANGSSVLVFNSPTDWGWALFYGFQTIFHLPANDFSPEGLWGRIIQALASILGPVLIALFGLALRQRLKR